MPKVVRLVTPAATGVTHKGVDAFENQLLRQLDWDGETGFDFAQIRATGGTAGLAAAANAAVIAAPNLIITDGSMATDAVRTRLGAATTPIIQAVGGSRYTGIPNVTGFYIDALGTCIDHLGVITTPNVSILYDATNLPSVDVHNYLVANTPAGKTLIFVTLAALIATPNVIDNSTFMLVPNAEFYNRRADIANAVHSRPGVPAIYPEREYKKAHPNASKGRVIVRGHHVPFAFRQAAHLADKILRGEVSVAAGTLPPMQEAEKDKNF